MRFNSIDQLINTVRIAEKSKFRIWNYEVEQTLLNKKGLLEFIDIIDQYPTENLLNGQVYHDKSKAFISVTVEPIKTTFIMSYYWGYYDSLIFPAYK